jgi:hypothetical protein
MAILTKPSIIKGQPNEIDLSKSELALLSKVVNDSYFSDQANWSKVIVEYKSAEGNQHEMMIFDATGDSPKGNFEVSEKARDSWEVQSVKIVDFDGGYLKLVRGDLTVADFDIALGSVGGDLGTILFSNSLHHPTNVVISSDQLTANFPMPNYYGHALSDNTEVLSGQKFYAEFIINSVGILEIGFSFYDTVPDVTSTNRYPSDVKLRISLYQNGDIMYGNNSSNNAVSKGWYFVAGDTIGIAIDTAAQEVYVKRNGVWLPKYSWLGPADPETSTDGHSYAGYGNATNGDTVYLSAWGRKTGSNDSSVTLVSDPADIPAGYKLLGS